MLCFWDLLKNQLLSRLPVFTSLLLYKDLLNNLKLRPFVKSKLGRVNANQKCQVFCKFKMSVIHSYYLCFFWADAQPSGWLEKKDRQPPREKIFLRLETYTLQESADVMYPVRHKGNKETDDLQQKFRYSEEGDIDLFSF